MSTESSGHDQVTVFDTTLRDGEQSPGASMNQAQKLEMAHALRDLGVDVMEVGFPVASQGDFEAVQAIGRQVHGPVICGLARCHVDDMDRVYEALQDAPRRRLHIFLATSPLHREFKLKMDQAQVLAKAVESVKYGREKFDDLQWSAEDSSRTELDFLAEIVERVIEAGATTINLPDTVGYAVPNQYAERIAYLKKHVRGIDQVVLSVHCHNDLGLAVANSLEALRLGARQVECTINGIGERAGNCSLEEVVMALRTRHDYFQLRTGIHTPRLFPTSQTLLRVTGLPIQRNKAVVGLNAFAHESGIHQHGVLANAATYEVMKPEDVGVTSTNLVLGKHSGRALLRTRVKALGYVLEVAQLDKLFEDMKALADAKREIFDSDLHDLVQGQLAGARGPLWELVSLQVASSTGTPPSASVCVRHRDGHEVSEAATGDGPVNAILKAVQRATGVTVKTLSYSVKAAEASQLTKDVLDAGSGDVHVEVEHNGTSYSGRAVDPDALLASARAFLETINRISAAPLRVVRQEAV